MDIKGDDEDEEDNDFEDVEDVEPEEQPKKAAAGTSKKKLSKK